jgi:uncharacterized membrane protein
MKKLSLRLRLKTRLVTSIVVLANVLGNFFLSRGLKDKVLGSAPLGYIEALFAPFVALGVTFLIVWMLSRMTLLSWADLSYVLPVTSIGYVLAVFMGWFFLLEDVSWLRWTGSLLIVVGVALVSSTPVNTVVRKVGGEDPT